VQNTPQGQEIHSRYYPVKSYGHCCKTWSRAREGGC
jgi:hypothetical protein